MNFNIRTKWFATGGIFKFRGLLFALITSLLCAATRAEDSGGSAYTRALAEYTSAKAKYESDKGNAETAWKFARACSDLADNAKDDDQKEAISTEGIEAARFVTQSSPANAAGYFFLALNIGELAQTKTFGALSLVKQMERALIKAIELDPTIEHGGPDRSLGMLYRDAPGRPFSVGNKSKARQHLEHAVTIASDYPDNLLSLMEGQLKWGDSDALRATMAQYEKTADAARKKYSGTEFEQAWRDWDQRWAAIQKRQRD
jgi:hypothetical protein